MTELELPLPVTREEQYLQAIYNELRALTAEVRVQRPLAVPKGLTELREPVTLKLAPSVTKPHRKKGRHVR